MSALNEPRDSRGAAPRKLGHAMRALGERGLPTTLCLEERDFRLVHTYKHAFASAVGLYRNGPEHVVLKCYRQASLLGLPLRWAGRLMAAYESYVLRKVQDLPGVPRLVARYGPTGLLHEYVPGEPLTRRSEVDEEFFPQLHELLERMHERGVAYVDLEKPCNILLGGDGKPYLIDFQIAFCWPKRFLGRTWPIRSVQRLLQKADMYHLRKHWRRVRPDQLSEEQIANSRRKPWPVKLGNALFSPLKKLRRFIFGKR